MSSKLLVAVQYCSADRAQAMEMARLIADLEPKRNLDVGILFAAQFDTVLDRRVVDYVSRKFQVWTLRNWHRDTGWPDGCTGLWQGIMQQVYARTYVPDGRMIWDYAAVFTPEPDSVPLVPGWSHRLLEEWDRKKKYVIGHRIDEPYHINGSAVYSCAEPFLRAVFRELSGKRRWAFGGFDVSMARFFERWGWSDTPLIRSYWRRPGFEKSFFDALVAGGAVWYHGIKTDEGVQTVRQVYGLL